MSELAKEVKDGGSKVYTEADCSFTVTADGTLNVWFNLPDGVTWADVKMLLAGYKVSGYSTYGESIRKNPDTGKVELNRDSGFAVPASNVISQPAATDDKVVYLSAGLSTYSSLKCIIVV